MRRTWTAIALLVLGGAVAPAAWSAAEQEAVDQAPTAALEVAPNPVTAGEEVVLDGSGSSDADGSVVSYAWDLDGDGSFERVTGGEATLRHTLAEAGSVRIGVRVVDGGGQSADAHETLAVEPKPEPNPEPNAKAAAGEDSGDEFAQSVASERKTSAATAADDRDGASSEDREPRRATRSPRLTAAASTTVTIRDFSFSPRTVTVNVGDTVTWRNNGPTAHTATANNGSFDTGNLNRGQSGSFTFRNAGTFAYKCTPHPSMTGTVRVVAAGSGGGGGGSGSGSSGSGGTGAASSGSDGSGGSLPSTGLALAFMLLTGLGMIGGGVALRRTVGPAGR